MKTFILINVDPLIVVSGLVHVLLACVVLIQCKKKKKGATIITDPKGEVNQAPGQTTTDFSVPLDKTQKSITVEAKTTAQTQHGGVDTHMMEDPDLKSRSNYNVDSKEGKTVGPSKHQPLGK